MLLLVTHGHPTVANGHPNLGRLVQPRHYSSIHRTAAAGIPWAADNDAYGGWDDDRETAWETMLDALAYLPGCLFVTARDVVGDAEQTAFYWEEYASRIMRRNLPAALVAQDGLTARDVPWGSLDAIFIGGTDRFKLGPDAERIVAEAHRRGKWTHMGRVNGARRFRYALTIGIDSVDGTSFARWPATWLSTGLAWTQAGQQLRL